MMEYFTMGEFIRSDTAAKLGIDNRCKMEHVPNIKALVANVLDPLRKAYGKPIRITSGFRCPKLNKAVGGSPTSQHMSGMAADIVGTPNTVAENTRLFYLIQSLELPFDQLIDEKGMKWVHVSFCLKKNRYQVLKL